MQRNNKFSLQQRTEYNQNRECNCHRSDWQALITFSVFLCFILADLFGHVKLCQTDQSCQHIEHKNRYAYDVIHSHAICDQ